MSGRRTTHQRIGEALCATAGASIVDSCETPWASATFTGARHRFVLALERPQDAALFDQIAEKEFDFPGHIVADIAVTDRLDEQNFSTVTIEVLTVEDR